MVEASSKRKVLPGKRADVLDAVGWIPVDIQTHRLGAMHDQCVVERQSGQTPPTWMRRHGSDGGGECPTLRRVKPGGSAASRGSARSGSGRRSGPAGTKPRPRRRTGRPAGASFRPPSATRDRSHPISPDTLWSEFSFGRDHGGYETGVRVLRELRTDVSSRRHALLEYLIVMRPARCPAAGLHTTRRSRRSARAVPSLTIHLRPMPRGFERGKRRLAVFTDVGLAPDAGRPLSGPVYAP